MPGYIKLHRQLFDSLQFSDPNYLKIWIWILLKANYEPKRVFLKINLGVTPVDLDRGQFVFGRSKAAAELNMDESKIYRVIKKFENDGSISLKSNNHYSILTVLKYDDFNKKDEDVNSQVHSQPTTSEQPTDTTKKIRKNKEEKNIIEAPSLDEVKSYFSEKGFREDAGERAYNYYQGLGWKNRDGKPVKNWKSTMNAVWFKEENKIQSQQRRMVY